MDNGLVTAAQRPSPAAPTSEFQDGQEPTSLPTTNISGAKEFKADPEEQKIYNSALEIASELLYNNDKSSNAITEQLKGSGDKPQQVIAQVTTMIVDRIEQQFDGQLPGDMVLPVAEEVSELVMGVGEAAGAFKLDSKSIDQTKGQVVKMLLDTYGVQKNQMNGMLQGVTKSDVMGIAERLEV